MADPIVSALREAATHRGYRLVASRRRKAGTGDFGKFGLTDPKGKPVLGIGDDGLTASAEDIESFLRGGERDTWTKSAAITPAPPKSAKPAVSSSEEPASAAPSATTRRAKGAKPRPAKRIPAAERRPRPAPKPREPAPLRIRKATRADREAIGALFAHSAKAERQQPIEQPIEARLAKLRKADGGVLVAERGQVVGCLAFALAPALHRPLYGRIATLVVADKHRREGVGRALIEAAGLLLAKAGCVGIEAMSDIDIRSAHGFFRRIGFEETSYRFAKPIAGKETP